MLKRELSNNKVKKLRVGGCDQFSRMRKKKIVSMIGREVYDDLLDELSGDEQMANDAGRWVLRGLCAGDAVYKAIQNERVRQAVDGWLASHESIGSPDPDEYLEPLDEEQPCTDLGENQT